MPEWLVSFFVGGIGGVVGGWLLGFKSGHRSSLSASDLAVAIAVPPFLYSLERAEIVVQFDEHGDGLFLRRETGIRPAVDLAEIVVPYRFGVVPGGSLGTPEVKPFSHSAEWRSSQETSTSFSGAVVLKGPFPVNQSVPGFELRQPFKKAFFTTKEETLKAYKDENIKREYVGIATYVPARILRCEVLFPPSHRSLSEGPDGCAFVGETEFINETETKRLSVEKLEPDRAVLTIEHPRPGIRYAITWLGPTGRAIAS